MNAITRFCKMLVLVVFLTATALVGVTAYAYHAVPDAVNAAVCEITTDTNIDQFTCRVKHNL